MEFKDMKDKLSEKAKDELSGKVDEAKQDIARRFGSKFHEHEAVNPHFSEQNNPGVAHRGEETMPSTRFGKSDEQGAVNPNFSEQNNPGVLHRGEETMRREQSEVPVSADDAREEEISKRAVGSADNEVLSTHEDNEAEEDAA